MDTSYTILNTLVILILLAGLIWSIRIRARQKEERDTGVSSTVKANPRLLNPVFLSYGLVVAITFLLIWFFKLYFKFPF